MSSPRYRVPAKLRSLLQERGMPVWMIGALSGMGYNRALRVLSGHPEARPSDRAAMLPMLTPEEQRLLPVEQISPCPVSEP